MNQNLARRTLDLRADPASGSGFVPLEAKLALPRPQPEAVDRRRQIALLGDLPEVPLVLVTAAAGYGKTTLLGQWASRDRRPVAWVSLDGTDNNPAQLLRYVLSALNRIEDIPISVPDAEPGSRVWADTLARVGRAIRHRREPFVLVLDNADVITNAGAASCLDMLVTHVPLGSQSVLAGRRRPSRGVARLHVQGQVLQLGAGDLAMTSSETSAVMRASGLELSAGELRALLDRTEGWPAGVRLAALALGPQRARQSFLPALRGSDRLIATYFREEVLPTLSPELVEFLTRTSLVDRLNGSLCDDILGTIGSGAVLEQLALRGDAFVVPLDRHQRWYRYHRLWSDFLGAELRAREPHLELELRRRAARWHEVHVASVPGRECAGLQERVASPNGDLDPPSPAPNGDLDQRMAATEGPRSLTAAELRVLALLPTYLSLRAIGDRLFVSRNTVKSQAIACYRKLGVATRSQAVERAVQLGLIER